jgi:hypothetical protein
MYPSQFDQNTCGCLLDSANDRWWSSFGDTPTAVAAVQSIRQDRLPFASQCAHHDKYCSAWSLGTMTSKVSKWFSVEEQVGSKQGRLRGCLVWETTPSYMRWGHNSSHEFWWNNSILILILIVSLWEMRWWIEINPFYSINQTQKWGVNFAVTFLKPNTS